IATGTVSITEGRIDRVSYEKASAHLTYANGMFQIDGRLDQAPGIWVTATGTFPLGLIDRHEPDGPMHVSVHSSTISLGLVQGFTDAIRDVTGQLQVNVDVIGTARDPHFSGTLDVEGAGFTLPVTGARYRNGATTLQLSEDRVTVSKFHLEDRNGRTLDVEG